MAEQEAKNMLAYEMALESLSVWLLGDYYYAFDGNCGAQSADDFVKDIKQNYPYAGMGKIDKWKEKHRKCLYCQHAQRLAPPAIPYSDGFCWCAAKKARKRKTLPRCFCPLFQVKHE